MARAKAIAGFLVAVLTALQVFDLFVGMPSELKVLGAHVPSSATRWWALALLVALWLALRYVENLTVYKVKEVLGLGLSWDYGSVLGMNASPAHSIYVRSLQIRVRNHGRTSISASGVARSNLTGETLPLIVDGGTEGADIFPARKDAWIRAIFPDQSKARNREGMLPGDFMDRYGDLTLRMTVDGRARERRLAPRLLGDAIERLRIYSHLPPSAGTARRGP